MPSFYCSELTGDSKQIVIANEEFHHLAHVLRHKEGDEVNLNSGKGWLGKGVICSISKTQAVIEINEVDFHKQSFPYAIAFSLLRNKNDEWLVEKVTESGVKDLFPMQTQYSVRNPSHNTLTKFNQTALNAIKQCNNPWFPLINPISSIDQAIKAIIQKGYIPIIASENRPDSWVDSLEQDKLYCFIIGPEGGFSPSEFVLFKENEIREICISEHVLRAETAAISIAAQYTCYHRKNKFLANV